VFTAWDSDSPYAVNVKFVVSSDALIIAIAFLSFAKNQKLMRWHR